MLWNHSIVTEGVDVPVTRGVLLLRKTQSLALFLQMAGRALRPVWLDGFDANAATDEERKAAMAQAGKPDAIILDPVGNYQQHGHILAPRYWSLEARSREERGEKAPTTTKCPRCYGIWAGRPRRCPDCGYVFGEVVADSVELKRVEGELVEIGVDGGEAHDMAGLYEEAMRESDPTKRARILARRGVQELRKAVGVDLSPTAEAWKWRTRG
jgi:superfamily II DNA or RNA helicase